jgi:hypothetical protein
VARACGEGRVHGQPPDPVERLVDRALMLAPDPVPLTLLEILRDREANEDGEASLGVGLEARLAARAGRKVGCNIMP